MKEEEICNTGLSLGLSQAEFVPRGDKQPRVQFHILFPSNPKEEIIKEEDDADRRPSLKRIDHEDEEQAANKNNDDTSDDNNNNSKNSTRKKLRLTKEQSTLLEDSFKEHTTLTLTQKQELADHLNLRPRQVEVWFQNRRARTKLKQTEVDCEYMKKYCERISEENRRLKKEVQELRSMKLRWSSSSSLSPLYIQVQSMCPSCERITTMTGDDDGKNTGGGVPDNKLYSGGKDDSSLTC